ncbi:MAG: hypothetical protein AB8G11_07215 [Saprospiraceae bacterium]
MFNLNIDFQIFWGLVHFQFSFGNQKKQNFKSSKKGLLNKIVTMFTALVSLLSKIAPILIALVALLTYIGIPWNEVISWFEMIKNLF